MAVASYRPPRSRTVMQGAYPYTTIPLTPPFSPGPGPVPGGPGVVYPPHLTDVTSGGAAGYGNYNIYPNYTPYVNALPEVMTARSDLATQGALSSNQLQQQLSSLIGGFGDPTALPGMAPGGKTLAQLLGRNIDPETAEIARANTIGANGAIGNSTVAQLYLAGKTALQNALNNSIPMGAVGSSQSGYAENQVNIANAQKLADATSKFLDTATGYINTDATTQANLHQKLADAITTGTANVQAHPDQYGVPAPRTVTVGGTPSMVGHINPSPIAAPTGVAAAARAATAANKGYFTPSLPVGGVTPGLGSGPHAIGPGYPAQPASPTGPWAQMRVGGYTSSKGPGPFTSPTPTIYHPNYGVS